MIFKLNPNVSLETLNPENQESYTISNETFLAWRIEDFNGKHFNASGLIKSIAFFENYNT
jgi:hypothetical protein